MCTPSLRHLVLNCSVLFSLLSAHRTWRGFSRCLRQELCTVLLHTIVTTESNIKEGERSILNECYEV